MTLKSWTLKTLSRAEDLITQGHPEASFAEAATGHDHTVTSDPIVPFSGEKLEVSVTKQDISTAHKIRPIIIRFSGHPVRDRVRHFRRKLWRRIQLTPENISPRNRRRFSTGQDSFTDLSSWWSLITRTWTRNGHVCVKHICIRQNQPRRWCKLNRSTTSQSGDWHLFYIDRYREKTI